MLLPVFSYQLALKLVDTLVLHEAKRTALSAAEIKIKDFFFFMKLLRRGGILCLSPVRFFLSDIAVFIHYSIYFGICKNKLEISANLM